jgi:HK97 gp10 family phage protein
MSSWRCDTKVDVSELIARMKELENIPDFLLEVAEEVVEHVRENIISQDVIDNGDLYDSITAEQPNKDLTIVRDGVTYGVYQEFGTSRIAPRPFFTPAIENYGKEFDRVFTRLNK